MPTLGGVAEADGASANLNLNSLLVGRRYVGTYCTESNTVPPRNIPDLVNPGETLPAIRYGVNESASWPGTLCRMPMAS